MERSLGRREDGHGERSEAEACALAGARAGPRNGLLGESGGRGPRARVKPRQCSPSCAHAAVPPLYHPLSRRRTIVVLSAHVRSRALCTLYRAFRAAASAFARSPAVMPGTASRSTALVASAFFWPAFARACERQTQESRDAAERRRVGRSSDRLPSWPLGRSPHP